MFRKSRVELRAHLAGGPHVCREEFPGEEEGEGLHPQLDRDDQEAGGQEARHLQAEHVLHQVWRGGDQVGEGREEVEADDGEDEGGEVHGPPWECHQDPSQSEGGD